MLNRSCDTLYEEDVHSTCSQLAKILVTVKENNGEADDQIDINERIEDPHDFASFLEQLAKYLVQHVNFWHFWSIVGSSPIIFKRACLMSTLMSLTKATNSLGEPISQKAIIASKSDPKLEETLVRGITFLTAWVLQNSGEQVGPIKKHWNLIEEHSKLLIMVSPNPRISDLI